MFISCGKFDRKKYSKKDLKKLDFNKNYDFKHKEAVTGNSDYFEWNLECEKLNCNVSYLHGVKKYGNTPIMEVIKIYNIANERDRQVQTKKVLNLLKSEDVKRELGTSDEEVYSMNLTYTLGEVRKYYSNGEIEKAVSEYINNTVNTNVSNEVREYSRRKETLLLLNILMINEEITNKKLREQNKRKLESTYISKGIKKATAKDADYLDKYLNEM